MTALAIICALGAGAMTGAAVYLRLRWVLAALWGLIALIAVQLFFAARGVDGFGDLAARMAAIATAAPAVLGGALAFIAAAIHGQRPDWRGWPARLTGAGFLVAVAAVIATIRL
ncbi:hypothetical protein [Paracoccus sp. (in: a-proteobacteria)]|uniref:hypothetical protein n=1 Tax=Paracoccus sp. TaxID=267 RepID=UPI0026DF0C94|nr:hypothetical protein [Paracoccus sp. (in: a-proteobacteria)]MDO5648224.1 hypothetical protein [Paracoccus sp. (in: a-proteobacteria)]